MVGDGHCHSHRQLVAVSAAVIFEGVPWVELRVNVIERFLPEWVGHNLWHDFGTRLDFCALSALVHRHLHILGHDYRISQIDATPKHPVKGVQQQCAVLLLDDFDKELRRYPQGKLVVNETDRHNGLEPSSELLGLNIVSNDVETLVPQ